MTTKTHERVAIAGAHASTDERAAADAGVLASDDVFALFPSEAETSLKGAQSGPTAPLPQALDAGVVDEVSPVHSGQRDSHYDRLWLAAFVVIGLAIGIPSGVLLRPLGERERSVTAPAMDASAGQALAKAENPREAAVTPAARPTGDGTAGMVSLDARGAAGPTARANTATAARPPRPGVSRPTRRQQVPARAADVQRTVPDVLLPSASLSGLAPAVAALSELRANRQHLAPTTTPREAPPAAAISVPVSASASDPDGDELTFRWSASLGAFADPTARQTTYVCPNTPRPVAVPVTVTVTDGKGADASDTMTVQCVATR